MLQGIKTYNKVPFLSDEEIAEQAKKQISFLKTIHYTFATKRLLTENGHIELRPILRGKYEFCVSLLTWEITESTYEFLCKYLKKMNGRPYCFYYSVFCYDHDKIVINKRTGKEGRPCRITNENAMYTTILVADFDNISDSEFKAEKDKFNKLGIETIDVFSGHGFQVIILLNHLVYDKNILWKFTNLLIRKGFNVDSRIIDPARIMRMPYSFNCKAVDPKSKYHNAASPKIIETTILNWTGTRYNVEEIFDKINKIPDVKHNNTETKVPNYNNNHAPSIWNSKDITEHINSIRSWEVKAAYKHILDTDLLPNPIIKMLGGTPIGLRNSVLLFLIPFFRNSLGFNLTKIKQVMCIWGEHCKPSIDADFINSEVERLYSYGIKARYGAYTQELARAYGYLDFNKYKKNNNIILPNEFFHDLRNIRSGSIRIYLALKLAEKLMGMEDFSRSAMQKIVGISERTLDRNIKDVLRTGYICKKKNNCNKRLGEKYSYYINPYFSATRGFTTIETSTIEVMLQKLTDTEMKLYIYICFMIGSDKKECWASQKYLAINTGMGRSSVTKLTNNLHRKMFLNKATHKENQILHCTYSLNY